MVTGPRVGYVIALTLVVCSMGCATMEGAPTPRDVDEAIRARTAAPGIRLDSQNALPPDVNVADGLGVQTRGVHACGALPQDLEGILQREFQLLGTDREQ